MSEPQSEKRDDVPAEPERLEPQPPAVAKRDFGVGVADYAVDVHPSVRTMINMRQQGRVIE